MTLFRVEHNKNFTVVCNYITKDKRLSWKAKGIWLYAFSRPNDWVFHTNDLMNQSTDGRDSVRAGLKELENCGYLKRERKRNVGKFNNIEWVFHETPQSDLKNKVPQTEKPASENRPLINTDSLVSIEKENKETTTTSSKRKEPPPSFFGENRIKKEALENSKKITDYCIKIGWSDKISEDLVVDLIVKHGYEYVADQFTYVTQQHMEALKSEKFRAVFGVIFV